MNAAALQGPLVPVEVDLRTAAAMRGAARYVDGKACVHGHAGERYTRNAYCVACQQIKNRESKARIRSLMSASR